MRSPTWSEESPRPFSDAEYVVSDGIALGVILPSFRAALPSGWKSDFARSEIREPDFVETADRMVRVGSGAASVSRSAPSGFLSGKPPAHSAECACFALNNFASSNFGLAAPARSLDARAADAAGCPVRIGCQPTPGWKQSPVDMEPMPGKRLLFPDFVVLRTTAPPVDRPELFAVRPAERLQGTATG